MCDFPSRQLLEQAHQVVSATDPEDAVQTIYACGFLKAMDELHRWHEYLTGCQCWSEALADMGWMERKPVSRAPVLRRRVVDRAA